MLQGGEKMHTNTRNKLDEVLNLLRSGETFQEVIKTKFSRSKKRYSDFLDRVKKEVTQEEWEILKMTEAPVLVKNEVVTPGPPKSLMAALNDTTKVEAFLKILENSEAILKVIEGSQSKEEAEDYFTIPVDYLKLNDTKTKSFRLSNEIDQAFNSICEELKGEYTKTTILNYVLGEFIKNYRNN